MKTKRLTESAMLIALAIILELVSKMFIPELPFGGQITLAAMLPVVLIAYRHGMKWGFVAAFTYSLLQMALGAKTVSAAFLPGYFGDGAMLFNALLMCLLDYVLAFTVLGLGGIFRRRCENQGTALVLGAVVTGALRYLLHVIAGCTVWAGVSIPDAAALVYSLAYNATYMVPEVAVTAIGAWYLSRAVNLRGATLSRAPQTQAESRPAFVMGLLAGAAVLAAAVWDVVEIFRPLQDPESGDLVIQNLSLVNWTLVGIVTAAGAALWLIFTIVRKRLNK